MSDKENETVQLTVEATIHEDALFLRREIATAKGDGFKIEVALNADGTVLVAYRKEGDGDKWATTYAISPSALVDAVLAVHKERAAAE